MPKPARSLAALLLLLLAGCAGTDPFAGYTPLADAAAIQHPHPQAVPHTDRSGAALSAFDQARSFFPLALSGALVDYSRGIGRGYTTTFLADFNAVTADPDQPLEAQLYAADGSRLQLLRARPETANDNWGAVRHAALLDAGDVVLVAMPRETPNDGTASGDAFARTARDHATQPVWALLTASARVGRGERLPDADEARLSAFAALISGASGLIWLGEDNYVARNAGWLGISPAPQTDYGIQAGSNAAPLQATPDDVAASRRLWTTVSQLNRRIARITPALLQPDATETYSIAARNAPARLRSLLKPYEDGLLLILLNAGETDEDVRIGFARALRGVTHLESGETVAMDAARGLFRDHVAARGVQLYRITLAE